MSSSNRDPEALLAENEALRRRIAELEGEIAPLLGAEERARQFEAFYRGLMNSTSYLIVQLDPQGRLSFVNDLYCSTFGKTREELIGSSFVPLIHEDDIPIVTEALKALMAPPYHVCLEERAVTTRGTRWFSWEDWALLDSEGNIIAIQAVGCDITDWKTLAADREALREKVIENQRLTLQALSTPLIPLARAIPA